jgi:hypothetical protein
MDVISITILISNNEKARCDLFLHFIICLDTIDLP